jgi:hypothetical protein
MKILKPGKTNKNWSAAVECRNGDPDGCGAHLHVDADDLLVEIAMKQRGIDRPKYDVSFECPCCEQRTFLTNTRWPPQPKLLIPRDDTDETKKTSYVLILKYDYEGFTEPDYVFDKKPTVSMLMNTGLMESETMAYRIIDDGHAEETERPDRTYHLIETDFIVK